MEHYTMNLTLKVWRQKNATDKGGFVTYPVKNISSEIIITEKLKNSYNCDRYSASVLSLNEKKSFGKILVNFKKDTTSTTFENGLHLKINGTFYTNKKPTNPDQFDYSNHRLICLMEDRVCHFPRTIRS